jgi:hypothetical protein
MPRLPDATDLAHPTPRPQRSVVTDNSAEIIGQAVEGAGRTLIRAVEQREERQDRIGYANARSALLQADIAARRELENDNDWQTYEERYREKVGQARQDASQFIRGRTDRARFEKDTAVDLERGVSEIRGLARRKEVDSERATLSDTLQKNHAAALEALDEKTRGALITSSKEALRGAMERGYISAQEESDQRHRWLSDYAMGALEIQSPQERLRALETPDKSVAAYLPPDVRARLKERTRVDLEREAAAVQAAHVKGTAASVLRAYEQLGPDEGLAALERSTKGLAPDIADDVYAKVQTGLSRRREVKQQAHADDLASLYEAIASNTADEFTSQQVDALWEAGALSPTERASLSGRVAGARLEGAKLSAAAATIREAVSNGTPLDPSNGEIRKGLAAAFGQDAQGSQTGSPSWQGLATAYAARTRMVPEQALSWARSALRSPDPAVAAPAAEFVAGVEASSPEAAGQFDRDTKAFAAIVNGMISAGTPAAKAIETARATVYDVRQDIVKQRREQYRELAKQSDGALTSFVDRDFDTITTSQPAISQSLSVDFNAQSARYFDKTGDIEIARDLAWKDIKRVYGPSRVNGESVMMALPPERFGIEPKKVRSEIATFVSETPQADGSTPEEILLVPDALTLRNVTSALDGEPVRPSYKLVTKTGDLVVDRNGVPLRYILPEPDLASMLKDSQDKAAKAVEQARFDREALRMQRELANRGEIR